MLEIQNVTQALDSLEEDEKGKCIIPTLGGNQSMLAVNESGLYALIFKSRKSEAKAFRRWMGWMQMKRLPSVIPTVIQGLEIL